MWEKYYSSLKELPGWLKEPASVLVEALPVLKRNEVKSILDLGCGVGRHCVYLAKEGYDVVGVDVSNSALKMARSWARKERLTNVLLVQTTMTNLPFDSSCFDAIVALSVIHHAVRRDIMETVDEIHRILKVNGVFLANLVSAKDPRFGTGQKVEKNTFRISEGFEEHRFTELHHFFAGREISKLLARFSVADIELLKDRPHYWKIIAAK